VEQKTELLEGAGMGELAWLVILSGSHVGKEFRLGEITSVGRSPSDNDVVLDDGAVSRQHAKIRLQEGAFLLHDLGSTGGTLVRQEGTEEWEEVHRYRLNDGDRVKMGRVILGFIEVAKDSK
jgi:pSer/pThr/pTyr-binding forkhead associated (FHA) protein